jgi:hypothetical protein
MRSRWEISVYATYFRSFYYYSLFATSFGRTTILRQEYIRVHRKLNTTDNGSVVFFVFFWILVNLIDDSDRLLAAVDVVAVAEATIVNCCCIIVKTTKIGCVDGNRSPWTQNSFGRYLVLISTKELSVCGSDRVVKDMKCFRQLKQWGRMFEPHSRQGCLCMVILYLCCPARK